MSYKVLARKWRPKSFKTMIGQSHVLKALSSSLDQERLHHAYLLTGTRGVGKTSIARILASCLNCEKKITSEPCGICSSCTEISDGRSVDLIEVDAASRTKVEDTRELLDNVIYAPTRSRYKIYLIDEVHMLSTHSFNALLKTLEEPPSHVIFILATTHPQKIPPTVLSRCLQFHLKNLTPKLILEHLKSIFDKESILYDEDGLLLIAKAASGSMRDALSLSDQAIAFCGEKISFESISDMLGIIDKDVLTELFSSIVAGDSQKSLSIISSYSERAPDFMSLIDELLKLIHRISIEQVAPGAGSEGQLYRQFIKDYAVLVRPEELQLYYQSLLIGKRDLPLAPDPITGIEMIVLRMLSFKLIEDESCKSTTSNEDTLKKKKKKINKTDINNSKKNIPPQTKTREASSADIIDSDDSESEAFTKDIKENSIKKSTLTNPDIKSLDVSYWCKIFSSLPLNGIVRTVSSHCIPIKISEDDKNIHIEFAITSDNASLKNEKCDSNLAKSLSIFYGLPIVVSIAEIKDFKLIEGNIETPAEYKSRKDSEIKLKAFKSLEKDNNINEITDIFGIEMDPNSVKLI